MEQSVINLSDIEAYVWIHPVTNIVRNLDPKDVFLKLYERTDVATEAEVSRDTKDELNALHARWLGTRNRIGSTTRELEAAERALDKIRAELRSDVEGEIKAWKDLITAWDQVVRDREAGKP